MDSKHALRREAGDRRAERACADLSSVVGAVVAKVERIAGFMPSGNEPGVLPRLGWLLPVLLADNDLDWAVYDGRLAPGRHGLLEPVGPRLGVDAIADCGLVLVPALLVDRRGVRLGRGGGSYDRALRRATGLTVALVHDDELVELLPAEAHDVRVAAVATPGAGLLRLTGKM